HHPRIAKGRETGPDDQDRDAESAEVCIAEVRSANFHLSTSPDSPSFAAAAAGLELVHTVLAGFQETLLPGMCGSAPACGPGRSCQPRSLSTILRTRWDGGRASRWLPVPVRCWA
ncbi:unnamed protein product, partial [Polarella glacialis]